MGKLLFSAMVIFAVLGLVSLTELCFPKVDTWPLNNNNPGILIIVVVLSGGFSMISAIGWRVFKKFH